MGVRLMVEVLDHWSDFGLTSGERSDLLVIAENANDKTRETFGSIHAPYILHRAGDKKPTGWKSTIAKLMKKGALEYAYRDGRPVSGHRGQAAVYRIPNLCPRINHDGLWGQCEKGPEDEERVTSQVTQSREGDPEKGHLSGNPMGGMGHSSGDPSEEKGSPDRSERVTSQVTPTPTTPTTTTSAEAEAGTNEDGTLPGMDVKPESKKPKPKKKTAKPKPPPSPEFIKAKELARGFWKKYGTFYTVPEAAISGIVQTSLENGVDRDALAFALDGLGKERTPVTRNTLQFALKKVYEARGQTEGPSMAATRTAVKCSEHAIPLPCSSCIGDIRAGDTEVPRRLLNEHGPEARPDLAEHLNRNGAAA